MMKISKLLKVGAFALLAASLCFTSCKKEDDDDEEGALSGSNNNYKLSYDNTKGTDNYRCYKTTTFKHKGALCQITLNNEGTTVPGAALGYIWDLASADASASAEEVTRAVSSKPRNFCIVGFNYGNTASGKVAYYVSRYTNVYDIQAENFGTKLTENKAVETEYIALNSTNSFTPTKDSNGNVIVTVNVYEETDADNKTTGSYVVDIYDGAVAKADLKTASKQKTVIIPASALGYAEAKTATQRQGAVYANCYKGYKVSASWKYADTYSADEVVEE